jgi:tRNA pseudouridine55 synthase
MSTEKNKIAKHIKKQCLLSMLEFNGCLLIDKPGGCTSHDVVARVRRKLGMKRIGHAGTLDPMATGLLIILVGSATKSSDHFMGLDKTYSGTLLFGSQTDTQDKEGLSIGEFSVPQIDLEQLRDAANKFEGTQLQTPPMYSAKKIGGQALYKLARKGKTIDRPAREITVRRFEITHWNSPSMDFFVECTKGTYIRTLAHDFSISLQSGGHLTALRRLSIGSMNIDQSIPLADFIEMDSSTISNRLLTKKIDT